MEAHGEDLRQESKNAELAEHVKHNYIRARLSPRQLALCKFAELLTRTPSAVRLQDVESLRLHGLSDRDISDAVEVIAYFNYINRVADGLGIDLEPEMKKNDAGDVNS
ncbi:MAG: peroxidase-related enzyme [Terriglobia bacterium]